MSKKNKIKYGLSNAHIFKITADEQGKKTTYGEAIKLLGAVTLSINAESSSEPFHADNQVYFLASANNGYTGSLELALIPDEFLTDILGMEKDVESGVIIENSNNKPSEFALAFQFEGDENATRHILYRCKATRPNIESETKGDSITPKTETFEFTSMARLSDGNIKAKATKGDKAYEEFFNKPFEKTPGIGG